jgi:hypothetical protein
MSQKKLDLFQLASRGVAEAGARAPQIMRRQFLQSNGSCRILRDVPDGFLGHAFTQDLSHLRYSPEDLTSVDPRSIQPDSHLFHNPARYGNRANVPCLALQIDNGPVLFPLFQMFESKANGFVAAEPAGKQQSQKSAISFALELCSIRGSAEGNTLFNTHAESRQRSPRCGCSERRAINAIYRVINKKYWTRHRNH